MVTTIPVGYLEGHVGNGGVAVAPNGGQVYLGNFFLNTVSVIDIATNTVVATIGVGPEPFGVALDPGGKHLYVTNRGSWTGSSGANTVSVIDTASNAVVTTLPPAGERPFGLAATNTNVYVAHNGSDFVSVIDI